MPYAPAGVQAEARGAAFAQLTCGGFVFFCWLWPGSVSPIVPAPRSGPCGRAHLVATRPVGRPDAQGARVWRPGRRRPGPRGPSGETTGRWPPVARGVCAARESCRAADTAVPGPGGCIPALLTSFQVPPLLLVEAAPDAEFVGRCRIVEALVTDWAYCADLPGLSAGGAAGREEDFRILTYTQAAAVPPAKRRGRRAGHGDWKQLDGSAAVAGAFGHGGSLPSVAGPGERHP